MEKLTKITEVICELKNIKANIDHGNKALILLSSLAIYFQPFKYVLIYGK